GPTVTADDLPAPGLSLSFVQSFQNTIEGRYASGILGFGWTTNWDIAASITPAGDVAIANDGTSLFYTRQPDRGYRTQTAHFSTLVAVNGRFQLTGTDGTMYVFNGNGSLASVQDSHGNRIATGYNGAGRLDSLTHTNGESITFSYNAQGHLASLADSSGTSVT